MFKSMEHQFLHLIWYHCIYISERYTAHWPIPPAQAARNSCASGHCKIIPPHAVPNQKSKQVIPLALPHRHLMSMHCHLISLNIDTNWSNLLSDF
jgi:hypothetical protein